MFSKFHNFADFYNSVCGDHFHPIYIKTRDKDLVLDIRKSGVMITTLKKEGTHPWVYTCDGYCVESTRMQLRNHLNTFGHICIADQKAIVGVITNDQDIITVLEDVTIPMVAMDYRSGLFMPIPKILLKD